MTKKLILMHLSLLKSALYFLFCLSNPDNILPITFGLVGKIGGFEAVPGLGVDTCLVLGKLGLAISSPKLLRLGRPGQLASMNGSLIGTLELVDAEEEGGETLSALRLSAL